MYTNQVISSLFYKFAEAFAVKGLGFGISIFLARLLSPEDFGQIAIITVFINLCHTFVQSGLSTALVQNKTAEHKDYSTVFYISLSLAVLSVLLLWGFAPWIGRYYNNAGIVLPLRVYSFSLLFAACSSVQQAKMQREMKFRQNMYCSLIAALLSGALGIAAAHSGWGLWSLILYYFSNTIISCAVLFRAVKWRPRLEFSITRAGELFSYGWKMLVSGVLCSLYNDIRTLSIGKVFSESELGYYSRGEQISVIIAQTLDTAVHSVMFPVLSTNQDKTIQFRKNLRTMLLLSSGLLFPAMIGLALVSEPLVRILLTEKWLPCVPFLQILCISYAGFPFSSSGLVAIKASGRSDIYMRLELVRRILMLTVLAGSLLFFRSVEAVAWGSVLSSWLDVVLVSVAEGKLFRYGLFCQFRDLWKVCLASTVMGGAVWGMGLLMRSVNAPRMLLLSIQVAVGIVVYGLLMFLLNKTAIQKFRDSHKKS